MTTVANFLLPISLQRFVQLLWRDKAWYEAFLTDSLEDINVTVGDWTGDIGEDGEPVGKRIRHIKSHHPSKISFPGLPAHAESMKTQTMEFFMHTTDKLFIKEVNSFRGIPYADYFTVNIDWCCSAVEANADPMGGVHIEISVGFEFHMSTWLQYTIEANTIAELRDIYQMWYEKATETLESCPAGTAADTGAGADAELPSEFASHDEKERDFNDDTTVKNRERAACTIELQSPQRVGYEQADAESPCGRDVESGVGRTVGVNMSEIEEYVNGQQHRGQHVDDATRTRVLRQALTQTKVGGSGSVSMGRSTSTSSAFSDALDDDFYDCEAPGETPGAGEALSRTSTPVFSLANLPTPIKAGMASTTTLSSVGSHRDRYGRDGDSNAHLLPSSRGSHIPQGLRIHNPEDLMTSTPTGASAGTLSAVSSTSSLSRGYGHVYGGRLGSSPFGSPHTSDFPIQDASYPYHAYGSGQAPTSVHEMAVTVVETLFVVLEFSYWQVYGFYQWDLKEGFRVTPQRSISRIFNSVLPGRHGQLIQQPDLYGPLLATLSLPLVLLLCIAHGGGCSRAKILGHAVVTSLCLWVGLSTLYRGVAMLLAPTIKFKHTVCMTGYSFYPWMIALLCSHVLEVFILPKDVHELARVAPLLVIGLPSSLAMGSLFWDMAPVAQVLTLRPTACSACPGIVRQWIRRNWSWLGRFMTPKIIAFVFVAATHYQFLWYLQRVFLPGRKQLCRLSAIIEPSTYVDILTQKEFLRYASAALKQQHQHDGRT